jgi:hypothetical protein
VSYKPYYPNGWLSGETGNTPITPEALNNMEHGIEANATAIESVQQEAEKAFRNDSPIILTEGVHYGKTAPADATKGRLYFIEVVV